MALDIPQIEGATCAAAGAVHVEPWRSRNQRRPDRRRPQHLTAGGEPFVPAVYNALRLGARNAISFLSLGVDADVEPARPDPHGGIIRLGVRQAKLDALALGTLARQLLADERPSDDWPRCLRLLPRVPEGLDDFGARWLLARVNTGPSQLYA